MFWTDTGNPPKIEKLTLHGTNRVAIVTTNLLKPYGITLDRRNKLIFWVDDGMDVIESVDYNGNSRKLLFHQPGISLVELLLRRPICSSMVGIKIRFLSWMPIMEQW